MAKRVAGKKKKKVGLPSNKTLRYMASIKPLVYMTSIIYGLLAVAAVVILLSMIGK